MYIVYGIRNCNTVKKALEWLETHNIPFNFHDYKKEGISDSKLKKWSEQAGFETLINKKGTTWRQLDAATQSAITNQSAAIELMKEKTSIIKRPLIELNNKIVALGFDEEKYKQAFLK